ncbi:DUF2586 domain-containing protein [Thermus sp. SYSU G05001]|uniref:DUF2586 domain-containing protein n=1 Tax=Thermus brevis TaxID=2862456 RepID=A0ABS6ZYV4_9DEIN|nr:DUF2586 family protein [Thermus brevis]MBW6395234.1 DUF2586 domain-containing protein [Thermus brevis]
MARLPGVYPEIQDGGLGLVAPSGEGQRVVVGVSSQGPVNQVLGFSELSQVPTALGTGPLARAVADQLAYGGGQVYAVRAQGDIAGTITPDSANPASPAVTLTGSPLDAYEVVVQIVRGGAVGTATFTYSLDGGDTVSLETATASTFDLPGTGVTLNFAAGTYTAGAVYRFRTTAPKASVSAIQAAVREALNSNLFYEYIQVAQPTDAAMWAALDALALEAENSFRYIFFLTETVPPGDDVDAWVSARLAEKASFSSKRVMVVAAWAEVVDTLTGRLEVQSLAARIGARISRQKPHVSPAWVQLGPLEGVVQVAPFVTTPFGKQSRFNNAHALALDTAGFTTVYRLIGRDGWFLVDGRMAAPATSDYRIVQNRRVMDKATTQVRQALLDFVQWHVDPTNLEASLASLIARANTPLRLMQAGGEIARGRVVVPPGQDILASQRLRLQVRIVPLGYLREIDMEIAFENPFLQAA